MFETAEAITIDDILENGWVSAAFQPLVSIKRKALLGVEALARCSAPGENIPPLEMFRMAGEAGRLLEFDRLCRKKALEAFAPIHALDRGLIVSLNVDGHAIDAEAARSGTLIGLVKSLGISPNNVLIEIVESRAKDSKALEEFVGIHRKNGFLIALDDLGAGHSNLDRIPLLKPDVLKLDRSLVSGVDGHMTKLEVVKSFVQMASRLGALALAEGVERQEDILRLLEIGVDVFQGYYFGRPAMRMPRPEIVTERIDYLAARFQASATERFAAQKELYARHDALVLGLCQRLGAVGAAGLDMLLTSFIDESECIECLYVLNARGVQTTDTVCNPAKLRKRKRFIYEPARKGADHSLKEYYLPLRAGLPKFTTQPYISLASGNRCITLSARCRDRDGRPIILCADLDHRD
ncbi:MAG: EAL domain-containing protein [Proteobacteria bacterium]|nr:EAL domain-containing protein [Pseudomonadota bacterium]MBU1593931.1 EAL domain-containing protein [Pseudomonadota bacterium]